MANSKNSSIRERILNHTGAWYPIIVLIAVHLITTPILLLLSAIPARVNAQLSYTQEVNLLGFSVIVFLVKNLFTLLLFFFSNREMFILLSGIFRNMPVNGNTVIGKRAWKQVTSSSKRYVLFDGITIVFFVIIPVLIYSHFRLELAEAQIMYILSAMLAANIVNIIMEILALDHSFAPMIGILLPSEFKNQLAGLKGIRLRTKQFISIFGLILIGILIIIPTTYQQVTLLNSQPGPNIDGTIFFIFYSGMGTIVIGVIISSQLVSYTTKPLKKMIDLFTKVEQGNLTQKSEISNMDEFGEVNLHLNHMIENLQMMTETLEQQVEDRTRQLSQMNEKLVNELKERQSAQDQLTYVALHDPLTDLPNRKLLMGRLAEVIEDAHQRGEYNYAVFFLDLDRFKVVNDSLGHSIGDLLLVECAQRLIDCVRNGDMVARIGGDEFVVLLEGLNADLSFNLFADRIQRILSMPGELGPYRVFSSVSIGVVLGDSRYDNPEDILRDADIAMYQAKNQGRGRYEVFTPAMLSEAMSRLEMENDIRFGLGRNEFILYYQPIFDLLNTRIIGFEALVRWQHPSRGLILPADFIPIAEETGLIIPLGYWIMDEACRQLHEWQEQIDDDLLLSMNINLTTRQCADIDLIDKITRILGKYRLDPGCLNFELSESLIVEDADHISEMLMQLHEVGVHVQIDDFGTGYSSLGYLNTLPIDILKIDRTFINQLGFNQGGFEVVQSIMALAHSLNMQVIAEGVETNDQLGKLKALGCEYLQGFLYAFPVDKVRAGELLHKVYELV